MAAHVHQMQSHRCKVITVSDTRTEADDQSGQLIQSLLGEGGHQTVAYDLVQDEQEAIKTSLLAGCADDEMEVVLLSGGTGIAKRDVTYEIVADLLEKELPGFGELFRMLSYQEDIGSAAMMSRAIGGVYADTAIFSMPGSSGAVRLAMEKLILPELTHVVSEMNK